MAHSDTPDPEKLSQLWHMVTGNGAPEEGLMTRVWAIEKAMERNEAASERLRGALYKAVGTLIVTIILAAAALLIRLSSVPPPTH